MPLFAVLCEKSKGLFVERELLFKRRDVVCLSEEMGKLGVFFFHGL